MRLFLLIFVFLTGCSYESKYDKLVLIDCKNGYHVQPPLACPDVESKF